MGAPERIQDGDMVPGGRWWWSLIPAYALVALVSVRYGMPSKLPGVALGFPALLDMERAGALLSVAGIVFVVAYMTSHGYLPTQVGNFLRYSVIASKVSRRQQDLEDTRLGYIEDIERRLMPMEAAEASTDEALKATLNELDDVVRRLSRLEPGHD
jgi:hypothetical protein